MTCFQYHVHPLGGFGGMPPPPLRKLVFCVPRDEHFIPRILRAFGYPLIT